MAAEAEKDGSDPPRIRGDQSAGDEGGRGQGAVEPDSAEYEQEQRVPPRGDAGWGAEPSGGSVVDKRSPQDQTQKRTDD